MQMTEEKKMNGLLTGTGCTKLRGGSAEPAIGSLGGFDKQKQNLDRY